MYINDVHILYYVVAGVLGLLVGSFINWCNFRLPDNKKVFSKDYFSRKKDGLKPSYKLMLANSILYIALLYFCGMHNTLYENLNLIKFAILIPMILSALVIDYRLQIIPNRLNLTIFEIGLLLTFIYGTANINIAKNMLLGMLAGGGIFLIITLIGGLIAGKEAMGLGDVKFMGAIGLYFGFANIIMISVIAFLIGAIISIALIVTKIKKADEYIPFGPFLVISSLIVLFVPYGFLLNILLKIFTLGMYAG